MPAWRIGRWAAIGVGCTTAVQGAVVGGLVATDWLRKRRSPPFGGFPTVAPGDVQVEGSTLTTYTYGRDVYEDMIQAIESAEQYVHFESYIFKGDATGQRFKSALISAAHRGVEVYVVWDGLANLVVPSAFKKWPAEVHAFEYPTFNWRVIRGIRYLGRDHRKLLVVDGNIGFIGGYNVGDLYATEWRDTHLRVVGPAALELENAFVDFWNHVKPDHEPELVDDSRRPWGGSVFVQRNAPTRLLFPVRGMYLEAIDRAHDSIWITQAYFIPDAEILEALLSASHRGVDVKVLMPERSNHVVADWVARYYYGQLLKGGVEIWLYQDAMVHAKTAVVDGQWATIGTANIDRLSLTGNFEINVELVHQEQARHLQRVFREDLSNARPLSVQEWSQRPWWVKGVEWVVKDLQPLL